MARLTQEAPVALRHQKAPTPDRASDLIPKIIAGVLPILVNPLGAEQRDRNVPVGCSCEHAIKCLENSA